MRIGREDVLARGVGPGLLRDVGIDVEQRHFGAGDDGAAGVVDGAEDGPRVLGEKVEAARSKVSINRFICWDYKTKRDECHEGRPAGTLRSIISQTRSLIRTWRAHSCVPRRHSCRRFSMPAESPAEFMKLST